VSGDAEYTSVIDSIRQIHLTLSNGHFSVNTNKINKTSRVSFDEKPIMIINSIDRNYETFDGETVSVKMRAVNAVGNGVASATAKTATTASAPKAAPAITSVTAGTGKVTVKYTAVATANNGGSAVTAYQYSINNGSTWLTAGAAAGFDISATKGATVSVKMRAVNAVGASVASAAKAGNSAVK
jgi:titin